MSKKFRISGLNKMIGIRRNRLLCLMASVVLVTASAVTAALVVNKDTSFADTNNVESVVDIRFLNTQNGDGLAAEYGGESNLIVTKDKKYVLIDTGQTDKENRRRIKAELDKYQNNGVSGKVTIDYLIISHLDVDHYGNAATLINNDNITVKNVVIKREGTFAKYSSSKDTAYDNIVSAVKSEKANLYTNSVSHKVGGSEVQNYSKYHHMNQEGVGNAVLSVGNYLKLYFYNTTDVFSGKTCTSGYKFKFTASTDTSSYKFTKDSKGRYYRINNKAGTFPNFTYEYASKLEDGGSGFDSYYYAYNNTNDDGSYKKVVTCLSNPNAYGVLAEVITDAGNKYVYFPNDLDNYAYDLKPTKTDVTYYSSKSGKNVTSSNRQVYGNGVGKVYKGTSMSDLVNNNLAANQNKTPSETKVALEIADKLGSNLSDLVIYQISHHGSNNAPDAINILNANRPDIYAINNRKSNVGNGNDIISRKTYYYALGNVKAANKMFSGYKKGNGVYCAINSAGTTKCGYNEISTKTLSYNMNGGNGTIETQSCWSDAACSMTVTRTAPTRSGYNFLGWATSANSKTATYSGGETVSLSTDLTLYAIWAPVYTLSYDANGGTGAPANQTCSPSTTTGTCVITVSATLPSRDDYGFLGWNTTNSATSAAYSSGSRLTMSGNKTLYAIWKQNIKTVNVNTSVNGVGGKISGSLKNVPSGTVVVITFTPNSGYEIDNVKVDGEIATGVQDNKLSLTVGDQDMSVVVTYRESGGEIQPDPDPPIQAFVMRFSAENGGTGFPEEVSCTTSTDRCNVTLPSTEPTRNGFRFLGYGLPSDRNTVVYVPGETYEITSSFYVIGVWAPIYTLSYDMNGGVGTIENQTCSSNTSPLEACSVSISEVKPTKEGVKFFGWAVEADATLPDYLAGDTFTFAPGIMQAKLYAVWLNESAEVEWWQGQNYEQESGVDLILKIDYPLNNFVALSIDGTRVDEPVYSLRSGSTIITISGEYANTLEEGGHILQAEYRDNVIVDTGFTVSSKDSDDSSEGGGDDGDDSEAVDPSDEFIDDDDIIVPNTGGNTREGSGGGASMIVVPALIGIALYMSKRFLVKNRNFGFEKHQD